MKPVAQRVASCLIYSCDDHCPDPAILSPQDEIRRLVTVVLGIRRAESQRRKSRPVFGESTRREGTFFCCPVVDWTSADIWDYIKSHNLPYCSLYDEGKERIGCIMCPMQGTRGMLDDARRYPKFYRAYLGAFRRMLAGRKTPFPCGSTAEEVMQWWIFGSFDSETVQTTI